MLNVKKAILASLITYYAGNGAIQAADCRNDTANTCLKGETSNLERCRGRCYSGGTTKRNVMACLTTCIGSAADAVRECSKYANLCPSEIKDLWITFEKKMDEEARKASEALADVDNGILDLEDLPERVCVVFPRICEHNGT